MVGAAFREAHQFEQGLVGTTEQGPGPRVLAAVEQVAAKEHEVEQVEHQAPHLH